MCVLHVLFGDTGAENYDYARLWVRVTLPVITKTRRRKEECHSIFIEPLLLHEMAKS